jgi:hypothetical protein
LDLLRRRLRARGGSGGGTEMGDCVSVFAFASDHEGGVSHHLEWWCVRHWVDWMSVKE